MKFLAMITIVLTAAAALQAGEKGDSTRATILSRYQPAPLVMQHQQPVYKDPSTATLRALGHTAIPIATGIWLVNHSKRNPELNKLGVASIIYGGIVGPSMGNFYADDDARGGLGIIGRVAGSGLMIAGISIEFSHFMDENYKPNEDLASALFFGGMVIGATSTLFNFFTASTSAKEFNAEHKISIAPGYDPFRKTASLSVAVRF